MVAKSGDPLLATDARKAIRDELPAAGHRHHSQHFRSRSASWERRIEDLDAMRDAARELMKFGCRVGGHQGRKPGLPDPGRSTHGLRRGGNRSS